MKKFLSLILIAIFISIAMPVNGWSYSVITSGGNTITWQSYGVTYKLDTTGGPANAASATQAAITTWDSVATSDFSMVYGGTTTVANCTSGGLNNGGASQDICFGDPGGGLLGKNYLWWDANGYLTDSDIILCQTCNWVTFDLESLVAHELGHGVPLDHSSNSEATMWPTVNAGETKMRTLHQDDIDGITFLYPLGGAPIPTLSEWAAILMTVLLASAGLSRIGKEQELKATINKGSDDYRPH